MTWKEIVDGAKELGQAGVAAYKDYTGGKLNEAEAKALKNTKEQPNWMVIGIVGGVVVIAIFGLVLIARRK